MSYIYKITNDINNKLYIGKTSQKTIEERFQEHIRDSQKSYREKRPLYEAFKKYGIEHFSISLIEEVENDEIASEREIYWIEKLNTYIGFENSCGYNATLGGEGKRFYDYILLAKEYLNLGTVKAVVEKYHCDEQTVRVACAENKIAIKIAPNQKSIKKIDPKTKEEQIFNSITEAARSIPNKAVETARKNISRALNKGSIAYGYNWFYI